MKRLVYVTGLALLLSVFAIGQSTGTSQGKTDDPASTGNPADQQRTETPSNPPGTDQTAPSTEPQRAPDSRSMPDSSSRQDSASPSSQGDPMSEHTPSGSSSTNPNDRGNSPDTTQPPPVDNPQPPSDKVPDTTPDDKSAPDNQSQTLIMLLEACC